jgi:hypothetical protein
MGSRRISDNSMIVGNYSFLSRTLWPWELPLLQNFTLPNIESAIRQYLFQRKDNGSNDRGSDIYQ